MEHGLLMIINYGGSIRPTGSRYVTTKTDDANLLQVGITDAIRESSYVLGVKQLKFLMLIPKN